MSKDFFIPVFVSMLILFALVSCSKDDSRKVELDNISIKTAPLKVNYYTSEVLDLTGLEITLEFDNGTTQDLVYADFVSEDITTFPENGATLTESTDVIFTHEPSGEFASLAINVSSVIVDIEGNIYSIVRIGDQLWMGENLKTTTYNDGAPIPLEENDMVWNTFSTSAYCWFDNNKTIYGDTYGALYNWYSVNTNKLCPVGWHVPTDEEWNTLVDFLGGEDVAGGKLKESGYSHWNSPNEGADNSSGFTGLPGGSRSDLFHSLGDGGRWWSSTQFDDTNAWALSIGYTYANASRYNFTKNNGYSVRCIRD